MFLGVFFLYPLVTVVGMCLGGGPAAPGRLVDELLSNPVYPRVLWFTTWQAAVSTILTLAAALPAAYVYARLRFAGKHALFAAAAVPFVLPSVVVAAGFKALLGEQGIVNQTLMGILNMDSAPIHIDQSIWFILLAHVFYNHPVVTRIVGGFWSRIPPCVADAARTLGASPARVFFHVTLPLLAPSVLAASMLVFTFCFSSFGVILILGGPRFSTIEVEIYRQALHLFNLKAAGVLSIMQISFSLAFLGVHSLLMRRASMPLDPHLETLSGREVRTAKDTILLAVNILFLAMLLLAPMAACVWGSIRSSGGFTLDFYSRLFTVAPGGLFIVSPLVAVLSSVGFASAALVLSVALALPAAVYLARRQDVIARLVDPVLMLPMTASAVILGLGFIVTFDKPPLNIRSSIVLVPLAHTLVAYPFVVRAILPALRGIPQGLKDAASTLGASPSRVFLSVVLPVVNRAVAAGAVFAFTMSIGEFGATLFVARPENPTMTLAVYRFLSQPGEINYGCAMAMCSILMAVTAAGFFILDRIRIRPEGVV